jgi:uroporphyrinogen-III decarboxylase
MWQVQAAWLRFMRLEVPQDQEMGLPETWPGICVDFANTLEASWFGCETFIPSDAVMGIHHMFQEHKEKFYDTKLPDPLTGNRLAKVKEYYDYFEAKRKKAGIDGRPVGQTGVQLNHDGPFTMYCNLRGSTEGCEDIAEDEKYFHDLMDFIVEGAIKRIMAWRAYTNFKPFTPGDTYYFADDACAMLSPAVYQEHVLPYHKRFLAAIKGDGRVQMHMCGKAQHQFRGMAKELPISAFEVGFPTDMARARKELGEGMELIGNISPMLLKQGKPEDVEAAVKKLCEGGVMQGGRFVLHDGHNCAPGTPLKNFAAMYEAGKKYGRYPAGVKNADGVLTF